MRRGDLRTLLPVEVVDGACLLADGTAVALVTGGAVPWDLLAAAERRQVYAQYHALLTALEGPLTVSWIDQALDLQRAVLDLSTRHQQAPSALAATILSEVIDAIASAAEVGATSQKQIIWQLAVAPERTPAPAPRWWAGGAGAFPTPARTATVQPAQRAGQRLAEQLRQLDGQPAPRPLRAAEILQCWWLLLDPIRARRVPLQGTLDRFIQPVILGASQ